MEVSHFHKDFVENYEKCCRSFPKRRKNRPFQADRGDTGQRATPPKGGDTGQTRAKRAKQGFFALQPRRKTGRKAFFPVIGSLAETRSLLRSRFFAAGFAQTCLNLRVRPRKPGGVAKKKRPGVFS
jgi:hypothetical protein